MINNLFSPFCTSSSILDVDLAVSFADKLTPDEMEDISSTAVIKIKDFANKQPPGAMLYVFNAGEHRKKTESTQTVKTKIKANKTQKLAAHRTE